MTQQALCPRCDSPLPGATPDSLCPKCLLAVAMADSIDQTVEAELPTQTHPGTAKEAAVAQAKPHSSADPTTAWANTPNNQTPLENTATQVASNFVSGSTHLDLQLEYCGESRFSVKHEFARGGLGRVMLARDNNLHRDVAIKEILVDRHVSKSVVDRFLHEAKLTSQLEHPGIIPIHSMGVKENGSPFYVMKLVHGRSLRDSIREFHRSNTDEGNLQLNNLLNILVSVCNAIAFAHSRGVIHRDLKPHNVMVGEFGESIVIDWGLAKLVRTEGYTSIEQPVSHSSSSQRMPILPDQVMHTSAGSIVGTLAYMAPEQARGETNVGPPCDIFALGAILYEILVGKAPYLGIEDRREMLAKVQSADFPPPSAVKPGVPKALEAICLKAMRLDPAQRYATGKDLANDIARWQADEETSAYPDPVWKRCQRWIRRHRTLCGSLAAALTVGLGALGIFVAQDRLQLNRLNSRVVSSWGEGQQLYLQGQLQPAAESLTIALELAEGDTRLETLEHQVADFLEKVKAEIDEQRQRADAQDLLVQFRHDRDQALFKDSLLPLERERAQSASLESLQRALSHFTIAMPWEKDSPLRFLSEEERQEVLDSTDELNFALAEAIAINPSLPADNATLSPDEGLNILSRIQPHHQHTRTYHLLRATLLGRKGQEQEANQSATIAESFKAATAMDHLITGKKQFQDQQYKQAKASFEAALRLDPRRISAQYFAALCELQLGNFKEAVLRFTACEAEKSNYTGIYLLRALAHGELNELELAAEDYNRALRLADSDRSRFALFMNRGVTALRQGKLDDATADFQRARDLDSKDAGPLVDLAEAYRLQGKNSECETHLLQAAKLQPDVAPIHRRLAAFYREQKQFEAALESAEKAIRLDQGLAFSLAVGLVERGRILHALKRFAEAQRDFRTALELRPDYFDAHLHLAHSCFELGALREAIEHFDRYLQESELEAKIEERPSPVAGNQLPPKVVLAMIYRDRGFAKHGIKDVAGAMVDYARAAELAPDPSDPSIDAADHSLFAMMSVRSGLAAVNEAARLARDDFDRALQFDAANPEALSGRAYASVLSDNIESAVQDALRTETLVKDTDQRQLHNVACVYAQAAARIAAQLDKPDRVQQADSYTAKAVRLLDQVIASFPEPLRPAVFRQLQSDRGLDPIRTSSQFTQLCQKYAPASTNGDK